MNYLDELNDKQFEAVTTKESNVLVMAGAGSGKTKVLTNRIRYLIENGESEYNIVAFTFTNKAAREMKFRLAKELKRDTNVIISTFHSFCYSWINESGFYLDLGYKTHPSVISENDKSNIIRNILDNYESKYSTSPFISAISKIKNKSKVIEIESIDKLLLNTVYLEYQQKLHDSNMIDFDDMIPLFIKLFNINTTLKDLASYKYILVDECQDTNVIQFELVNLLASYNHNIFMVGDEDQLIYSFRNSSIDIIKDFKDRAHLIILNKNYRCNKAILEKANALISYNTSRFDKKLTSDIAPVQDVIYGDFLTEFDEARHTASMINKLIKEYQINPSDIAVLYRNNIEGIPIEKELNKLQIPYVKYGDKPFYEEDIIKGLIYLIRLLFNPTNEIAFYNVIHQPFYHIEIKDLNIFLNDYKKQTNDLIEYASNYINNKDIKELGLNLKYLKRFLNEDADILFNQIIFKFRYIEYYNQYKSRSYEYDLLMEFKTMISQINVNELNEYINNIYLDNESKVDLNNKVSLLTIHKAKGLEFDTVFVVGCNQEIMPGVNVSKAVLEEERRIFYVAMTRAKNRLYLYSSNLHYKNFTKKYYKPSIFLTEANIKSPRTSNFFGKYYNNR